MADIFVSYKRQDRSRVGALVEALETLGYTVWWDASLIAGQRWSKRIKAELDAAKCVIVIWTCASVADDATYRSDWVENEAILAQRRGILVPVLLDSDRIPWMHQQVQHVTLVDWSGDANHTDFDVLRRGIAEHVLPTKGLEDPPTKDPQVPEQAVKAERVLAVNAESGSPGISTEEIGKICAAESHPVGSHAEQARLPNPSLESDVAKLDAPSVAQRRQAAIAPLQAAAQQNQAKLRDQVLAACAKATGESKSPYRVAQEIDAAHAVIRCLTVHSMDSVERARLYQLLIDRLRVGQREIAAGFGIDSEEMRHSLKLLYLPEWCQELLRRRVVTEDEYRTWLENGAPPPETFSIADTEETEAADMPMGNRPWHEMVKFPTSGYEHSIGMVAEAHD